VEKQKTKKGDSLESAPWRKAKKVGKNKKILKTKNKNALESLLPFPHPKVGSQNLFFGMFFFFVFFSWYPSPSKTQPKTSRPKRLYVYSSWCGGEVVI